MITVIDYGAGNLGSVGNTLTALRIPYTVTSSPGDVLSASALILPGVGAAAAGMEVLRNTGLDTAIVGAVGKNIPLLGICLGMQLLFGFSEEGNVPCLGIIPGTVVRLGLELRVPQIGWNQVDYPVPGAQIPLWNGIPSGTDFYFVNSYVCKPDNPESIAGITLYGEAFVSAVVSGCVMGTQFHPEKSGRYGQILLQNFYERYI